MSQRPAIRSPVVRNPPGVARKIDEWRAALAPDLAGRVGRILREPQARALVEAVFGSSPYLSGLLLDHPASFMAFAELGPDAALERVIADLASVSDVASTGRRLRAAKAQAALLVALADISCRWSVDRVTEALSDFADACLRCAVRTLLTQAHGRGAVRIADLAAPETNCGYAVLALGKHGGRELNYSSDIDLFVFFDEQHLPYAGKNTPQEFAVQMTKDLVRLLQERTAQGYVFRTDLRLRPDPGSTSLAVSRAAAQSYYESYGQNWERAALIKARAVAGDLKLAADLLHDLQSFIWRKSLDFYALQDIHSIKRQIYAQKGGGTVEVAGHNIKLGRGGIREIEFFVQIQQLIWGGRFPEARGSQTLAALDALTTLGFVQPSVRDELAGAYRYLRELEHRLQMINDEQTQTLPGEPERLAHIAAFMGHRDTTAFIGEVEQVLRTVERHYAGLFEDAPPLTADGNLVFTGAEEDPDTIATLARLGYRDTAMVAQTVRGWHHGRYRATRSDRARQLLTEVMPSLLAAFAKTAQPDAAFIRFDRCLSVLTAGVPLLSVFYANPELLDLVAEIMGDAPRLAEHLSRSPALLDYVLTPEFYQPVGGRDELRADLDTGLAAADSFEAVLDLCRRWAHDQQFRVGVHALRRMIDPIVAAEHLSAVAEAALSGLAPRVCDEFSRQFGRVEGGQFAILAYGKLASCELTPTSDLDLVFIYDAPPEAYSTGGEKSFPAPAYYNRLAQRLVSAFTVTTREGTLYHLDMRLRPNGDKGPLACSLEAFVKYQNEDAWTWEHQALTRTRVVQGAEAAKAAIDSIVADVLDRARDPAIVVCALAEMRARMRQEQKDAGLWDLKRNPGGLIDAEFILQYLSLKHPVARTSDTRPRTVIASLVGAGVLSEPEGEILEKGITLWSRLQFMVRLMAEGELPDEATPLGLKQKLAATAGVADFDALEELMRRTADQISALFSGIIETPAIAARKTLGPDAVVR